MAPSPSPTALRKALALMTGGALLLAGCGSDGAVSSQEPPAPPASAVTTGSETTTDPDTTAAPDASASPEPEVAAPEETADSDVAAAGEEPAEEIVMTIVDFAYELPETVPPGATVTVVNEDTAAHTVTSTGAFEVNLTGGQTGTFTAPEEPGEYTIFCLFHGNMSGTLVVG